ncbi:MAG: hypothetical protein EBV03_08285, partial [Proteobacteria bacterium]|nr:hypothetical protein [Pseudomonadota bacterium]
MEAIVPGEYVSDFTKKTLEQFGWVAGDPIPQNMGDLLAKISERTPASKKAGVYIDADVMAETDVAAIKHALELAKKGGDIKKVPFDPGIPMPESTRQLLESLQDRDENNNTVEIVDDRAAEKPPAEPEKKEDTPVEQPIIPDPLPEAPAIEPFCPRCSWDMRHKFDVEISEADKEAFIAITLGGERFKKTYEIFAGKYAIRFRSMLAEENSEIH